ncbi:hypothetical protein DFH09DRAFT_1091896 [Mycena vulgaris]|nr:hypothetical protein DFH09DRAFT_1091896 [Mycena vulgaris]
MAHVPSSDTFPPFAIRKRLLTDFIEMEARYGKGVHAGRALDDMIDTNARARVLDYRGLLGVYFGMEDHIGDKGALIRACLATIDYTQWISRVQQFVRDGLVVQAPEELELVMQLVRLKMKRGKWVWVQLTTAELIEFGYPSNFPGLLF